jgi:hypothetical protein
VERLTVACVYKTGGVYTREYVNRLRHSVAANLHWPHQWVCLSDDPEVATHALHENLPGWWSKFELMTLSGGRVLYFDLDTVIHGDITPLAYVERLTLLRDFYRPDGLGSGLMMLPEADRARMWEHWEKSPHGHMGRFVIEGDQAVMEQLWLDTAARWQDVLPGMVVSYKAHQLVERKAASVTCYHGQPKPHETGWAI